MTDTCINPTYAKPGRRIGVDGIVHKVSLVAVTAIETLHLWQTRASQRRGLLGLDDRLLRDIGVTRAQAEEEARKPFWRP